MALLTCSDVTFSYEGIPVLTDVNFALEAGSTSVLWARTVPEKSTLIKGLLHLKKIRPPARSQPATGFIQARSAICRSRPPHKRISRRASGKSCCPAGRTTRISRRFTQRQTKRTRSAIWSFSTSLPLKKRCYRDLSGGQQQRVLLARALCATKKLLLLDEPVTGLDPVMTNEMYQLIRRINREQNVTIIMVSHDIRNILPDATHILQLDQKQVFFGPTNEYLKTEAGKQFLGGADL